MERDLLWLWFQLSGVTRTKKLKLLSHFEDIEDIYSADVYSLKDAGMLTEADINSLSKKNLDYAKEMQRELSKLSASVIPLDSDKYPELLKKIHQPPVTLYARGSYTDFNSSLSVAMVGTRKATNYGRSAAYNIARELSENGVTVVSGLAMGIDAKSHEGALAGGSPTVAVIASGLDSLYPKINTPLMNKILSNGAVISEYLPGTPAERYHFPERNSIIAGMCKATVVVEADLKSGSLITAKHATEENRDVFAVPGNITSSSCKGSNFLLKDGANMLTSAKDILDYYNIGYRDTQRFVADTPSDNTPEGKILSCIGSESVLADIICQKTGLDIGTVNANLMMLEIKGKVIKLAGGYYIQSKNI